MWDLSLAAGREWDEGPQPAGLSSFCFPHIHSWTFNSLVTICPSFPPRTTPSSSCAR